MTTAAGGRIRVRLVDELSGEELARCGEFVRASPGMSHLQSPGWARRARRSPLQRYLHLLVERGDELVVTGVVRSTRLFPGVRLASLARGPVFASIDRFDEALPAVVSALARAGFCTALMGPRWEGAEAEAVADVLRRHGFSPLPPREQPLHVATGLVDLCPSEEKIHAGFKARCRRQIRAASRQGLAVRPAVDDEDARRFRELFRAFEARKGRAVSSALDVMDQWEIAREEGGALLLAELDGQLVGGHVVFRENDRAFWVTLASSDAFPSIPRSYNLVWEAMRLMKKRGCLAYDVAGFPLEEPRDEAERNRMQFKSAFAPRAVPLVGLHAAALAPVPHALLFRARQWYRRSPLPGALASVRGG